MYFYLVVYLALSTWGRLVLPAPLPETEHMAVMRSSKFQDAAENALSLVTKILDEIPAVHKSLIDTPNLSLDASDLSELQFFKGELDLPEPSPLHPISDKFKLDVSLGRIAEGLKLHKILLKVISEAEHFKSKKMSNILSELRDALLQLHKMEHLIKAEDKPEKISENQLRNNLAPKLNTKFISQVAAHLALIQLREFFKDTSHSLQSMIIEPETQDS